MIAGLTGQLADVTPESIVIDRDGLAYEVLVPACTFADLAGRRGQRVTLHTFEYLEGNLAGGNLVPRLVGFLSAEEREFFRLFTTVKGVGMRKGLRALAEPIRRVAAQIEAADVRALARLPGIGPRTAQQIVAELRGKMTAFARGGAAGEAPPDLRMSQAQRDALELLVAWGDPRPDAQRWLLRAAELESGLTEVEQWVKAAYRVKSGAA